MLENNKEKEEKLEFLKREEIRTMGKDVNYLREVEAQKERDKIAELKPEPTLAPAPAPETATVEPVKENIIPRPALEQNSSKKILVRAALIASFILVLSAIFWINIGKFERFKKPPSAPQNIQNIPKEIITLSKDFTKIALTDFPIAVPPEILNQLEPNYILANLRQKEGQRTVLIAKIKNKEELDKSLKAWEMDLTKEEISFSGQKFLPLSKTFKNSSFQGASFRYLPLAKSDLGVCYLVFNDYFALTTSFGSMQRTIQELTAKEKLGQLFLVGIDGKTITPQTESFLRDYKPGGVVFFAKNIDGSGEQLKSLISQLQDLSLEETGLPLFIAVDQEGDPISRVGFLAERTSQNKIKDVQEAFLIGRSRGQELKDLGINLNLAPVLDMAAIGDFIFNRSFQKPAEETGELAKSLILGQKTAGILTAMKHFPGYNGIAFDPEETLAAKDKLPPFSQFVKAMDADPELIMISNAIYKEIDSSLPFTFSPQSLRLLKDSLNDNILIMTDDLAQNSLIRKGFTLEQIVSLPIEAGVDILSFSGSRVGAKEGIDAFIGAFQEGKVQKDKVEKAILRITQLKQKIK